MRKRFYLYLIFLFTFFTFSWAQIHPNLEKEIKKVLSDPEEIEAKVIEISADKKKEIEKKLRYKILENSFTFYVDKSEEEPTSYCFVVSEKGKLDIITVVVAISKDGYIKNISVVDNAEVKTTKIGKERFLRQFISKTSKDPVRLRKDIDAISRATVSSAAATKAVRKALVIWQELFLDNGN